VVGPLVETLIQPTFLASMTTRRELQQQSLYTAAMTGCGFMLEEMNRILPLLMADNSDVLLKQELDSNEHLLISNLKTRSRAIPEFKRRFNAVPKSFWGAYLNLSPKMQTLAMFFVQLKAYKMYFDFQVDVVRRKWNSFSQMVTKNDLLSCISEIACNDPFVDSWSDNTRNKIASAYITVLRKVGFLYEKGDGIHQLEYSDTELHFFVQMGEPWFLDAILLDPYRIDAIKSMIL
jgi:hypothetical protein